MKKILIFLLVFFIFIFKAVSPVKAVDYYMISEVGTSAEMIAFGNVEGFSRSASVLLDNPAALYKTRRISLSLFHTNILEEYDYSNIAVSARTEFGIFGFATMSATCRDIPYTRENEYSEFEVVEYFNYFNSINKFSYQFTPIPNFHLGVSFCLYELNMYNYQAYSNNLDVGTILEAGDFTFSFTAKNIVDLLTTMTGEDSKVNFSNTETESYFGTEYLPLQLISSLKYKMKDLQLFGQFKVWPGRDMLLKSFGINYKIPFIPFISFSGGYKEFPVIKKIRNNFTTGISLYLDSIEIYYAYENSEYIEQLATHYLSLNINF